MRTGANGQFFKCRSESAVDTLTKGDWNTIGGFIYTFKYLSLTSPPLKSYGTISQQLSAIFLLVEFLHFCVDITEKKIGYNNYAAAICNI